MTDFALAGVEWVLLAGGLWYPVLPGSFDFLQGREWSTREGAFGWGYTFVSGDHRLYGPVVGGLTAIAIPR
jgi:hypothetical protein